MSRPVIFLDIDGVVVTDASLAAGGAKCADSACVALLNQLVAAVDAEIVISSSWRTRHTIEFIRDVLSRAGFAWPERVIDVTERMHYRIENGSAVGRAERADEIRAWLAIHRRHAFVILDDDLEAEITGHFVRTRFDAGLSPDHVIDAIRLIRRQSATNH
jgi:HAD domain in Swiss Army Knife RNA repair proteins